MNHRDSTDLATMVDQLTRGWLDTVPVGEVLADCTDACRSAALALPISQLKHYSCECPRHLVAANKIQRRVPLILELTESSYSKPVIASDGGSGPKLHPPLPGDLVNYDEVRRMLESAAWTVCADWELDVTPRQGVVVHLEAIRLEIGARLGMERDDAAAVLRPAWRAVRVHLGYERRPLRLQCEQGHRMGLEATGEPLLACEGPCGCRIPVSAELAAEMAQEAAKLRCKRRHEPNWRLNAQGNQVCQTCTDLLKARRAAKKAKDRERLDSHLAA